TWSTNTAIEGGHQVWKEAPTEVNKWTHYSFNVTTTTDWKGVIFYIIDDADGFTGYIDNLTIKDSQGNVVSSFEPTADDLSNTSNGASIVKLSEQISYEKNIDYAVYVDNSESTAQSNKIWFNVLNMPQMSVPTGKTYTLKFDIYTLSNSTTKFQYQGVHNTGGGMTDSDNRWETTEVLNQWTTETVQFTATGDKALAYHTLIVGAGFEGYLDNFRVYDGETLVTRLEFDVNQLDKTHECATVVALEPAIAKAKGTENYVTYKMLFDNGEIFRTTTVNAPVSIKFSYCLMNGSVKFNSNTGATQYLELGRHENYTYTGASDSTSFMFTATSDAELYVWDVQIVANGKTVKFASRDDRTTCEFEIIKYDDIPEYVEKDYGMLVDTTSVAADGSDNKSFWFNDLGMDSYYNTLESGKTYTFAFDVYPLIKTEDINLFHFRTSNGSADNWGGFWKGNDLVANKWNTTSTTFTVDSAANTGNHILFVFGGFKGYIDNVRIIDSNGNVVAGTATGFAGLTVPEKHNAYLTIDVLSDELSAAKEPCIHVYNAVTTDATCTEAGSKVYTCTLCGDVVTEVTGSAAGHIDADGNNVCDVCNDGDFAILIDNSQGTGYGQLYLHEVGMPSLSMPAGNYIVEFDFYALAVGDTNFPIQITNGSWTGDAVSQSWINTPDTTGKWVKVSKEVTATETGAYPWFYVGAGIKGYMDNFKVIDKATGDVILTFEGTYADFGKTSKTINTMVALDAELKAAKETCVHKYNVNVSYPNCEEDGVKNYVCSICGDFFEVIFATALGHTYDNDYDADCNVCGDVREVACAHEYDNACDAECNLCGVIREVGDHVYGDWVIDVAATTNKAGSKYRVDEDQLKKLDAFLDNDGQKGRSLLYFASASQPAMPAMEAFLSEWGIV
ncbi:MAG: hypothetical protein IJC01_02815, partial [Clostridia bacterium]|nr:hypothetical protein [Clostridia bacterium]